VHAQTKTANTVDHWLELLGAIAAQQDNLFKAVPAGRVDGPSEKWLTATSSKGVGTCCVVVPNRVPNPPTKIAHFFRTAIQLLGTAKAIFPSA
jgi:hypothetical protein